MGFDWKQTLGTVAPAIATALGTPLAGVAVSMACRALGLTEDSEDALQAAVVGADPQVLVQLREVDRKFEIEMKRLDIDLARISAQDRDSARGLAKAKGIKTQAGLSVIFIAGFFFIFSVFVYAMFAGAKLDNAFVALFSALIGILTASVTQIMNFWFGSSSGSKEKTEAMASAFRTARP